MPQGEPHLVGSVGFGPCHNLSHPPVPPDQPMPGLQEEVAWQRPSVHKCRCGLDLRTLTADAATPDLVAINAAIYRAAGFPPGEDAELDLVDCGFPPEMLRLGLGALLRLALFVGSIREKDKLRRKQRPFTATDLAVATEIDHGAVAVLREWPRPLREVLRNMLPPEVADPAALNFSNIFGNFYRHLFRVLPRNEFGFLHEAFEKFVIEDWKGFIRGQHRYFSAAVRQNSQWVTANEAEVIARHGWWTDLGPCPSGPNRRHIPERAPGRQPDRVLDSTGIAEPMDCCSRRGTRALHAAHPRQRGRSV